jgi:hypothetical protein
LLLFPLETSLKIQLTTDKKSWTELKLTSSCWRLFTATHNDIRQLDKASWKFVCFTKIFAFITEDIFKEKLIQNISFPSVSSYSKKAKILKILCPPATARFSLVRVSRGPDACYSYLKTLTQFQNPHGPFKCWGSCSCVHQEILHCKMS